MKYLTILALLAFASISNAMNYPIHKEPLYVQLADELIGRMSSLLSKKHHKLCERYCNEQNFNHLLIEKCEVKIDNIANRPF